MKYIKITFFLYLLFLTSCGIENPESAIEFAPPLGLVSFLSNGSIWLQFWGYNNETYFEGYNIYISDNPATLVNYDVRGERILQDETAKDKPTIEVNPFSDGPRLFTFEVKSSFFIETNNVVSKKDLVLGNTYYFNVRAYGNKITGRKASNIVTNQYTP